MISKYTYKKLTWIDLESPSREEILRLMEEYDIPALPAEELITKSVRSKVDVYDNLIYLILHFPIIGNHTRKQGEQEIDFIVGKNFLITTHYETVDPLHTFAKIFEVNSILDKSNIGDHAGYLFYFIIKELYRHSMIELEELNSSLKDIENSIFEGKEGAMVETISLTNRKLVDFKQAIRFHGETLRSFERVGKDFFGESFSYHLSAITGEHSKVASMLEGHKEILKDLKETNDSLLTNKTNETIKTLTIMNFIMLPLTLITGVFGMNADIIFINSLFDFIIVISAMTVTGLTMFMFFKKKGWL